MKRWKYMSDGERKFQQRILENRIAEQKREKEKMQTATTTPGKQFVRTYFKEDRVKLKGKKRTELRKEVYIREKGICQECGNFAQLLEKTGKFNKWTCGHMAHIKSEGAGGEDVLENMKWKCPTCHLGVEHAPQFSKGKTKINAPKAADLLNTARDFKMPWGKFAGKLLWDLPDWYLTWLVKNCRDEDIAGMADATLKWRKEHGIIVKSEKTFH